MNENQARRSALVALGSTGPSGNEKAYWNSLLTALHGTATTARSEHEFWTKFAAGLAAYGPNLTTEAVVSNGEAIVGTGGTFTVTVAGGVVTGGTWVAA